MPTARAGIQHAHLQAFTTAASPPGRLCPESLASASCPSHLPSEGFPSILPSACFISLQPMSHLPCLSAGSLRENEKKASLCPACPRIPHTQLRAQYTEDTLSNCSCSGVPSDAGRGGHAWISLHPHTSPVWSASLSSFHNKGCGAQRSWVDCLRSLGQQVVELVSNLNLPDRKARDFDHWILLFAFGVFRIPIVRTQGRPVD